MHPRIDTTVSTVGSLVRGLLDRIAATVTRVDPWRSAPSCGQTYEIPIAERDEPDANGDLEEDQSSNSLSLETSDSPTSRSELDERGIDPEVYVATLLDERGGRMKQREFVDDLGWSPATASRLLADLERDDAIVRYRVGRENIVTLSNSVPFSIT